jgi:hypothetical protein
MGFCASCGQPRNGAARFCGTCGSEFKDSPDDQGSPESEAAQPGSLALPDIPLADTDSFKSWYQPASPSAGQGADSNWQQTQTVQATPTEATGYSPTAFTPGNPFSSAHPVVTPADPPGPPGRPLPSGPQAAPPARGGGGGGGKNLFITLAVVVVLAAGGGAYALATTLGKHSTAQPSASTSASGTTSPGSASPSATPSPTLSLVAISPGVTASAEPQVETLLSDYFQGINTHSYTEYASTLNPAEQAKQTAAQFASGYSTTTDSGMTLTDLASNSDGGMTATVTFTSRQSPSQSVDNSACNAWTLNLYLVPQGSSYLIGPAPSGYQPTYSDC